MVQGIKLREMDARAVLDWDPDDPMLFSNVLDTNFIVYGEFVGIRDKGEWGPTPIFRVDHWKPTEWLPMGYYNRVVFAIDLVLLAYWACFAVLFVLARSGIKIAAWWKKSRV